MVATNFQAATNRLLVHEGGYVNHPKDPGGATNLGVTERVYHAWLERQKRPRQSVRFLKRSEAEAIYKDQYWRSIRGDDLPIGLDYVVYDGAANSGPKQSGKWLQGALKALGLYLGAVDGVIGNGTLAAVAKVNDVDALIARICDLRLAFMRRLTTWATFGRGWTSRVNQVGDAGQDWAVGSVPADKDLVYVHGMEAKAFIGDLDKPAAPVVLPTAGAGGGTLALAAQTIQQAVDQGKEQLLPFAGSLRLVDTVLTVLTVAGVGLAIFGLGYGLVAKVKRDRAKAVVAGEELPA